MRARRCIEGRPSGSSMRAILSHVAGGPETLRLDEVADPVAAEGQVVVAVRAVGINFPDSLIIADRYQFKPQRPFAPGAEVAGTVEAVGPGVTEFRVGDRVLAVLVWGGLAEKVAVEASRCHRIPAAMPFAEAAAFVLTYGTAYHALRERARLQPSETLVVLGAAGGVGLATVELGRVMGARVIAAVSTAEKLEVARRHGAQDGIVYGPEQLDAEAQKAFTRDLKHLCGPDGADVICDPVGGTLSEAALRAIAWKGRFLVVGFPAGIPKLPLNLPLLKGCDVLGVFWGSAIERDPAQHAREVAELLDLYTAGTIRPAISKTFPLAQAGDAIAAVVSRRYTGKVVVTVA
jgi:NADPH2:quinone reductase